MTKIAGFGSIRRRHGSADPDPDPHQNAMDPQHCSEICTGLFIPDPYPDFYPSRIQGSKRHRIPDPQHLIVGYFSLKKSFLFFTRDKVERKKAQNRTAAFRYREKKKAEQDAWDAEICQLEGRNTALKARLRDIEQELRTVKRLMLDTGLGHYVNAGPD
jgi:hypothetical protein